MRKLNIIELGNSYTGERELIVTIKPLSYFKHELNPILINSFNSEMNELERIELDNILNEIEEPLTIKSIGSFLCGENWEWARDPFSKEFLNNVAYNGEESKILVTYLQERATIPAEDIVSEKKEFVRQGPLNDDLSHDTFWEVEGEEMIIRIVIPGIAVKKQLGK